MTVHHKFQLKREANRMPLYLRAQTPYHTLDLTAVRNDLA